MREISGTYRGIDQVGQRFTVWCALDDRPAGDAERGGARGAGTAVRMYGVSADGTVTTTGIAVVDQTSTTAREAGS